jgi:hypothetical protein
MEVNLEINAEKTKWIFLSHHQTARQNNNLMTANKFFENIAEFKSLGMKVTNQNCIYEEIKNRLNSGNASYCSVQNVFPSPL